ncbi:MAG: hypothetical protein ABH840_04510 [Nanoarchaeota archaeon]
MKKILLVYLLFVVLSVLIGVAGDSDFSASSDNDLSWIGNTVTYLATEDTVYYHNFSANITGTGENITFSISEDATNTVQWNYTLVNYSQISSWIFISNSTTGELIINATRTNQTGFFSIPARVSWINSSESTNYGKIVQFNFNVSSSNDAPNFTNLENRSFNILTRFEYILLGTDEESNIPYNFNITFLSCALANWSDRGTNCTLFSSSQYSANNTSVNISFIPGKNDVGNYSINFTINDSGTPSMSTSMIFNFSVLDVNTEPFFTYICDNERNTTENSNFTCYINATDYGEEKNLTFSSNASWFLSNNKSDVNITTGYKGYAVVNFTPSDFNVGNWSINISVNDSDSPVKINSSVIWFYIDNVNDSVIIYNSENMSVYNTSAVQTLYFNATDDDLLISGKSIYNESLTFSSNETWVNASVFSTSANRTTGMIQFNPQRTVGLNLINISVRDANNFSSAYYILNITILGNSPPSWNSDFINNYTLNEDQNFLLNLSANMTDADSDSFNFSFSNYTSFLSFSLNSTTGIIDFTPVDEDVGYHLITINVTDGKAVSSLDFNFTVYNLEDAPVINLPLSATNASVNSTNSNINATENYFTFIYINITDNDLKIPSGQKGFYNESINLSLTIQGANTTLFSFVKDNSYPSSALANISLFSTNFTPYIGDIGDYNITINISDVNGSSTLLRFNLTVNSYDALEITNQPAGFNFTAIEGNVSNITVSANHTLAGNLSYDFYIDNVLRYNLSFYGNVTNLTWQFTPNYTDENYGLFKNISLIVYNPDYPALNVSRTWNINITHADSPITFITNISNQSVSYSATIPLDTNQYFSYPDKDDVHYNRTISGFSVERDTIPTSISYSFVNSTGILTFSSSEAVSEFFNITLSTTTPVSSATSNNFLINFTTPVTTTITTPSSGGGGGGSTSTKYHAIKIISPDEMIVSDKNYIEIPISVKNTGTIKLIGINLSGAVSFDNFVSEDVTFSISTSFIDSLSIGEAKNLTVLIHADTHRSGKYRVSVYANVLSPKFTDWGDFFIELKKANETEAEYLLTFVEKMIFDNPECLELTELINEAQKSYNEGHIAESIGKTREAVQACKAAIEGKSSSVYSRGEVKTTIYYMIIITLAVLFVWAIVYFYKRIKFNKARREGYV